MAAENVELVRRVYEAVARRDAQTVLSLYHPEVEWDHTHGPARELMGGPQVYHGHDGLRTWFREWYDAWENVDFELEEVAEAGEQVVSVLNYRGRGRASGIDVAMERMAGLWTIQEGTIVRVAWFRTRAEAFAAAS